MRSARNLSAPGYYEKILYMSAVITASVVLIFL